MLTADERERYLRHILLKEVGAQGQQKLLASRVLVVGAGGLGAPLLLYLAAAGVGTIGIADDDEVALSNLQRQVIFRTEDVGAPKTRAAAAAVTRLNPDVSIIAHATRLDDKTARSIIKSYEIVAEGIDNFDGRYALNRACIELRVPLVSAAVGRFEGQLSVFKPYAAPALPCYRCLVPEPPLREEQINCAEEGVLGPLTGVLGSLAAMEVLKDLLGLGESLAGKLLRYDGMTGMFRSAKLAADPRCPDCSAIDRGAGGAR